MSDVLEEFCATVAQAEQNRRNALLVRVPPVRTSEEIAHETVELIQEISSLIGRFVILPHADQVFTLALYVLHTWVVPAAITTPYIVIESPEKQSGKTQLQRVLGVACKNAINTASISAAALYQLITQRHPTLLIDETDAIFGGGRKDLEDLRGAINAGFQRGTPWYRGDASGEAREFDVFGPKVLAGIATGKLPPTIRDRAIVIAIERKLKSERVERWKTSRMEAEGEQLRERLEAWSVDALPILREFELTDPILALSDRQEDAWEPLLAIAHLAGHDATEGALRAAERLSTHHEDDAETDGHKLIVGLRDAFGKRDKLSSAEVVQAVNCHPTLSLSVGSLDQRTLAKLLRPYKIIPRTIRMGNTTRQGYHRHQFLDAWARYASSSTSDTSNTTPTETGTDTAGDVLAVGDVLVDEGRRTASAGTRDGAA